MAEYRSSSHTVYDIKYHFVWITKYRYKILRKNVAFRLRELLQQGCDARNIKILKGSIGVDHVHMLLSCPTNLVPSQIMRYLKGRSSKLLQDEFPELRKRYWGQHMWGRGYFCGTVGEVDEETIRNYIENQGKDIPIRGSLTTAFFRVPHFCPILKFGEKKNPGRPCFQGFQDSHLMRRKGLEPSQDELPLEPESSASAIPPSPLTKSILTQNSDFCKYFL